MSSSRGRCRTSASKSIGSASNAAKALFLFPLWRVLDSLMRQLATLCSICDARWRGCNETPSKSAACSTGPPSGAAGAILRGSVEADGSGIASPPVGDPRNFAPGQRAPLRASPTPSISAGSAGRPHTAHSCGSLYGPDRYLGLGVAASVPMSHVGPPGLGMAKPKPVFAASEDPDSVFELTRRIGKGCVLFCGSQSLSLRRTGLT